MTRTIAATSRWGWAALALLGLAACAERGGGASAPAVAEVHVYAAASLKEAFEALAPAFEARHPGTKVVLNFAGSQALRVQIENGAPADVFASADAEHLQALQAKGLVDPPVVFARNDLVVVVPRGNPARVASIADLAAAPRVVLAAAEVPAGRYARRVLDAHGADLRRRVEANVVSHELNVRLVLNRVAMGEADAGIVYRTDARSAGDRVETVAIPAASDVVAEYPIARVKSAPHTALAAAWMELTTSAAGRAALTERGFLAAEAAVARQP